MKSNKKKRPNREQAEVLKANGMTPAAWEVVKDLPNSLIVHNWVTGEFQVVEKAAYR